MTKTDAAVQTLSEINPDVVLEVGLFAVCHLGLCFKGKLFGALLHLAKGINKIKVIVSSFHSIPEDTIG